MTTDRSAETRQSLIFDPANAPTRAFRRAVTSPRIELVPSAAKARTHASPSKGQSRTPAPSRQPVSALQPVLPPTRATMSRKTRAVLWVFLLAMAAFDGTVAAGIAGWLPIGRFSQNPPTVAMASAPVALKSKKQAQAAQLPPALLHISLARGLEAGLTEAGADPALADAVISIFSRELNAKGMRGPNNVLDLLVEPVRPDAQIHVDFGRITAARLTVRGVKREAFRFVTADGQYDYYRADGAPTTRYMLRHPTTFDWLLANLGPQPRWAARTGISPGERRAVMSVGGGRVVRATRQGPTGATVEVRHADGWVSQYMHLNSFRVTVGSLVVPQQVIGDVAEASLPTVTHYAYKWGGENKKRRLAGTHKVQVAKTAPFSKFVTHARVAWRLNASPAYASDE